MLELKGLRAAEKFVTRQQELGNDVRWEGFDRMIFFRPDPRGQESKHGEFRSGVWGFKNIASVDSNGVWRIDFRNVRRTKRARART